METLDPNPSFAQLKRFSSEVVGVFEEFMHGLERFGREPGETWHALADEFIGRFLEVEKMRDSFKGRASLPTAERRIIAEKLRCCVDKLHTLQARLRKEIVAACPPLDPTKTPNPATEALWKHYDSLDIPTGDHYLERTSIQRMLRRAHDPVSVMFLVLG